MRVRLLFSSVSLLDLYATSVLCLGVIPSEGIPRGIKADLVTLFAYSECVVIDRATGATTRRRLGSARRCARDPAG
jgi:hypothetical protein